MKDKALLIRIAASPEGIRIDPQQNAPGRGTYVCRDADCIKKSTKTRGLERSLKRPVPSEIYEKLSEVAVCQKFEYTS